MHMFAAQWSFGPRNGSETKQFNVEKKKCRPTIFKVQLSYQRPTIGWISWSNLHVDVGWTIRTGNFLVCQISARELCFENKSASRVGFYCSTTVLKMLCERFIHLTEENHETHVWCVVVVVLIVRVLTFTIC